MQNENLKQLLTDVFIPLGFKRKGNNWILENTELIKTINLQKSNFSNSYYINYGFTVKGLQLKTGVHVWNRLHGNNVDEGFRIRDLLDLENNIADNERLSELKKIINDKIINEIQLLNTTESLKENLKKRPHLNDIPIVVHQYFNL